MPKCFTITPSTQQKSKIMATHYLSQLFKTKTYKNGGSRTTVYWQRNIQLPGKNKKAAIHHLPPTLFSSIIYSNRQINQNS